MRDTLGASDPSPRPDGTAWIPAMGRKIFITSGCKNQWGLGRWKKQLDMGHLQGLNGLRTFTNPSTLGFTTGAAARRVPAAHRKGVKWLERVSAG